MKTVFTYGGPNPYLPTRDALIELRQSDDKNARFILTYGAEVKPGLNYLNACTNLARHCCTIFHAKVLLIMTGYEMKTAICDNWHFWESNGKIIASNETIKKLYSFDNFDNACNWLAVHNLSIAKAFYKAWKDSK